MAHSSEHRVAIVTGASSGIGLAAARMLSARGYALTLASRSRDKLEQLRSQLSESRGPSALVIPTDTSKPDDVERLIFETVEARGRLDVLINNAGAADVISIPEHNFEYMRRIYDTNAIGPALAIARAWPYFVRQRSGCIINVSSYASLDPFPGFFSYAATKAAMDSMVRSCRNEGAQFGIRAFSVAPGATETPLLRSGFSEEVVPRSMCLSPEEVAQVIIACIEGRHDADSGKTLYIKRGESGVDLMIR